MLSPLSVAMAFQNTGNQQTGVADLLHLFEDESDLSLLLWVVLLSLTVAYSFVAATMIFLLPKASHLWYWSCGASVSISLGVLIYLVEPRPLHWLPSLERIRATVGTPSSWSQGVRRWWRWRKKYERQQKTKLNV